MSNESEAQELHVGAHVARFEPPDVFLMKLVGDYLASEILAHAEFYKRARGKFYIIVDTSEMGAFTSEAKKKVDQIPLAAGVVIFGGSRQAQLIMSLLTKVYMMVNRGKAVDIKFVADEAEARAWVEQLRRTKG